MARGRNGAPKKPETSSSMDKGRAREFMLELARVFPSQKKKNRSNYLQGSFLRAVVFCWLFAFYCLQNINHPVRTQCCPSTTGAGIIFTVEWPCLILLCLLRLPHQQESNP